MSSKEVAIKMQKQGYDFVVLTGEGVKYAKTVREAGDMAKGVKGARVMKMREYLSGGMSEETLDEGKSRLQLVPAYGRDYKSKKEVEAAWNDGKDFMIQDMSSPDDGRYINIEDAKNDSDLQEVNIRFKRLTQVAVIKIKR
jgi:hypothetical protein